LCFLHYGIPDAKGGDVRPIKKDWDRMCHLDLKPCNIFLMSSYGKHPRVVLGDFGCAVTARDILQGEESPFEQGCGTPEWYPPEGRKPPPLGSYGPKTDMWQLGASLHVMGLLIGRPERDTLASRTPLGRHYGRTANSIVHELTRDNASKRYSAATLVKTLRKRY
jgi:serine/threonine protein kinase